MGLLSTIQQRAMAWFLACVAFLCMIVVNSQAAVLDTNLTEAADELTTLFGGTIKPLVWAVVLMGIGISWVKLTKKR